MGLSTWWLRFWTAVLAPFLQHFNKKQVIQYKIQRDLLEAQARLNEDNKDIILAALDAVKVSSEHSSDVLQTWLDGFTKISQPMRLKTMTDEEMAKREAALHSEVDPALAPSTEDIAKFVDSLVSRDRE